MSTDEKFKKELDGLLHDAITTADFYGTELVRQVKISHEIKRTAESVRRANLQCIDDLIAEAGAVTTNKLTDARASELAQDIAREIGLWQH